MSGRAVDAALLHPPGDPAAPVLAGSRCAVDGTVVFPAQASCPRCSGRDVARVALPERGVLWSWTVQHFRPRAPFRSFQPDGEEEEEFEPFAVGYVDLGPVVVESRLALPTPAPVREHGVAPVSLGETGATPCSNAERESGVDMSGISGILRIGMPMRLCPLPLWAEADGDVVGFAFRPDGDAA